MKQRESPKSAFKGFPRSAEPTRFKGESPKGFFLQVLRADPAQFHRAFAKWLRAAGFEIATIRRRTNHGVWNIRVKRGAVPVGREVETVEEVIRTTVERCGVMCPAREIEARLIGTQVGAAFIFPRGTAGSLVFTQGRESWCADAMP